MAPAQVLEQRVVVHATLDEAWQREIAAPLGLADYAALQRALDGEG
jgi:hypothetical protein